MDKITVRYCFDNQPPAIGDKIVKAFLGDFTDEIGKVKTIVEDNSPTPYHLRCDDGSGYNKIAEHGWRRLVKSYVVDELINE